MTPNQSHVAGLELALSKVDPWSDRAVWLRDLIDQAKSAPAEPDAELVELLGSKFPRIDPCQPVPLDEKVHCCEYSIYVERERLHRLIDAKLANLEVMYE